MYTATWVSRTARELCPSCPLGLSPEGPPLSLGGRKRPRTQLLSAGATPAPRPGNSRPLHVGLRGRPPMKLPQVHLCCPNPLMASTLSQLHLNSAVPPRNSSSLNASSDSSFEPASASGHCRPGGFLDNGNVLCLRQPTATRS